MPVEQPEGPAPERLSSNVMNYLIWRYLQESGTFAACPRRANAKALTLRRL
jgi:hypothetical protein